jgi:hypothetical protein
MVSNLENSSYYRIPGLFENKNISIDDSTLYFKKKNYIIVILKCPISTNCLQ